MPTFCSALVVSIGRPFPAGHRMPARGFVRVRDTLLAEACRQRGRTSSRSPMQLPVDRLISTKRTIPGHNGQAIRFTPRALDQVVDESRAPDISPIPLDRCNVAVVGRQPSQIAAAQPHADRRERELQGCLQHLGPLPDGHTFPVPQTRLFPVQLGRKGGFGTTSRCPTATAARAPRSLAIASTARVARHRHQQHVGPERAYCVRLHDVSAFTSSSRRPQRSRMAGESSVVGAPTPRWQPATARSRCDPLIHHR